MVALGFRQALWFGAAIAIAVLCLSATRLRADPVTFRSVTLADMTRVAEAAISDPVEIQAELNVPTRKVDRLPAVVVAHTIGGYSEANEGWFAAELRKAGFATLVYDSFKARKWSGKAREGDKRVGPSVIADAFSALKFLARHPKIDAQKIAIVGFSLGGDVAHSTAFERFRKILAPEQRFAAHVSFYPGWTTGTRAGKDAYTGAPILLLFGEKDELTPTNKVLAYLDYLKARASNSHIETLTYSGAYHAWTNPMFAKPRFIPDLINARKCPTLLVGDMRVGLLIDQEERRFEPTLWQQCLLESRGYTMGFSSSIRSRSLSDAISFLNRSMGSL